MHKRYDLAAIVNHLSEADLAGLSLNDVLALLEGLHFQAPHSSVRAARERLLNTILRDRVRGSPCGARRKRLH
jgi:hypothetical protein